MALKASNINEKTVWQDLTEGLQIHEPATSKLFETGEWRTSTPIWMRRSVNIVFSVYHIVLTVVFL